MSKIKIIIGPTAIGKSDYAIQLAKKEKAEIISADAFQVYRGMDIGTAKVSQSIRHDITHHLIDILNPDQPYNVVQFVQEAQNICSNLKKQNIPVIICGGTGLYLRSFIYKYDFPQSKQNPRLEKEVHKQYSEQGIEPIYNKLISADPKLKSNIHINNHKRILRNYIIHLQTGEKPSEIKKQSETAREDVEIIGLTAERNVIYDRINIRVKKMVEDGLVEEVKGLLKQYPKNCLAFQALGYKETIAHIQGSYDLEEMIELIQKKTRHFAKRQLTWFNRFEHVTWHKII